MKNAGRLGWFFLCLFALGGWLPAREACIDCHADESAIKSLFTPPAAADGEEGEG